MPGAVIGRPTPGASVLEKVDKVEGAQQVAMTEDEVLVELRPALAVEVYVKELPVPKSL